jgi:hypothetical protein
MGGATVTSTALRMNARATTAQIDQFCLPRTTDSGSLAADHIEGGSARVLPSLLMTYGGGSPRRAHPAATSM